jgi:alkylation response protein AidB-like acyl-CoA dehydrogenase
MTATNIYKSNLRDTFFNLFEVLNIGATTLGKAPFTNMDADAVRDALVALEEFAREDWGRSFVEGDRVELGFDGQGNVTLPPGLTRSLKAYYEQGWDKLDLPEHLGGFSAPPSVSWAGFEFLAGANASAVFYLLGNFLAKVIDDLGTTAQKARYVKPILEQHWGGTMVLTEPDAGSDVGAGLSRARHVAGDEWLLEGTKRFITNGDYDQPANIVHLVLARPEGHGPGTKGLSMFIVPKFWVEEDGSLGARNGAVVTKVEKKMGLKGSATCELTLGADSPCRGLLVGEVHDGIAQMFHVIEYARMGVGTKSVATLSTAYLNALQYTKERIQGPDLAKAADKTSPRVPIVRHPDVRRMLMLQKAFAEGLRSLVLYVAWMQDQVAILGGHGAPEAEGLDRVNDLLLPIIKGYSSERGYELLGLSLQCYGGSGYIQDYPAEQYLRDQKIDSLYEGTTHIQAQDLFFRKIGRDRGATLQKVLGEAQKAIAAVGDGIGPDKLLGGEAKALAKALGDLQGILMATMGKLGQSIYHVGLHANRILFAMGDVLVGWRLLVGATVAAEKLTGSAPVGESDKAFYQGKIAALHFYCAEILPGVATSRSIIESGDLALMELAEEAF